MPGFVVIKNPLPIKFETFAFAQACHVFLFTIEPGGKKKIDFGNRINVGVRQMFEHRSDKLMGQVHRPFHEPAISGRIFSDVFRVQTTGFNMFVAINQAHFELRQVSLTADISSCSLITFESLFEFGLHFSKFVAVGGGIGK